MEKKRANKHKKKRKTKSTFVIFVIVILMVLIVFGFSRYWPGSSGGNSNIELFTVKRGNLAVTVIENGSIKPVKSVNIKAPQLNDYYTNIVSIVPEGTFITPEDVNNLVLVELDSSGMVEQLPQLEINVSSAESSFAEAKENFDIRIKQNESDITAAELKVQFARMDLQKYLGKEAFNEMLETASLETTSDIDMDLLIKKIEDSNSLCEASQRMLDLTSSINMAEEELEKSNYNLEGVQKLFEHDYSSESELREAQLQVKRQEINLKKDEINLALFKSFEFPKQVKQLLSDYLEAELALERTQSNARSQLNQAEARLRSAESSLKTRQERLKEIQEQIESCTIKAPSPGQVVYYSSMQRYFVQYPIEQGAQIPRSYTIIVIPDTTQLLVEIKINETWINRIEIDQKAKITTTAFPDEVFYGKVLKKAPMADSQTNSLMADVKVYTTEVSIDGTYDYLKTGMTAKVEILIEELKDVLFVPIQAVVTEEENENKVCFVMTDKGTERREVEIGLFNDDFVEIKSGLAEGEQVLYNPPRWDAPEDTEEETEETEAQSEESEEALEDVGQDREKIHAGQAKPEEDTDHTEAIVQTEQTNRIEEAQQEEQAGEAVIVDIERPD